MDKFDFCNPNLPKKGFWGWNFEKGGSDAESAPPRYHVCQFSDGQFWIFRSKFAQKWILWSEFWKTKSGCRISSSKIPCMPIFRQNGQLWLFRLKFAQKMIWGLEFRNSKSGFEISISIIPWVPIFRQNGQLWIFRPKFGEFDQLRAIFWFLKHWGCCRELDGG